MTPTAGARRGYPRRRREDPLPPRHRRDRGQPRAGRHRRRRGAAGRPDRARPTMPRPKTLPPFTELAQRSVVFDAAGNQIDIFKQENREPFKLAQVPPDVIAAVLAVEDESFYSHKGVNLKSLVRAMLVNVSAGEVSQGGSHHHAAAREEPPARRATATPTARSSRRAYAWRVEQKYTKDEILERYLNTVYLGNNTYGLQAAAETYFGKNVDQLDIWRGRVPRRAHPQPVGLRPVQPSGAITGPLQAGRGPTAGRRQGAPPTRPRPLMPPGRAPRSRCPHRRRRCPARTSPRRCASNS